MEKKTRVLPLPNSAVEHNNGTGLVVDLTNRSPNDTKTDGTGTPPRKRIRKTLGRPLFKIPIQIATPVAMLPNGAICEVMNGELRFRTPIRPVPASPVPAPSGGIEATETNRISAVGQESLRSYLQLLPRSQGTAIASAPQLSRNTFRSHDQPTRSDVLKIVSQLSQTRPIVKKSVNPCVTPEAQETKRVNSSIQAGASIVKNQSPSPRSGTVNAIVQPAAQKRKIDTAVQPMVHVSRDFTNPQVSTAQEKIEFLTPETSPKLSSAEALKSRSMLSPSVPLKNNEIIESPKQFKSQVKVNTSALRSAFQLKLKQPILRLHRLETFNCNLCNRVFLTHSLLYAHRISSHTLEEQAMKVKFKCTVCGKVVNSSWSLQHHMRFHKGEEAKPMPYECDKCDSKFMTKFSLTKHNKFHCVSKSVAPASVELCELAQGQGHTVEEGHRIPCSTCGRSYKTLDKISKHLKSHERSCCGIMFRSKAVYAAHVRKHIEDFQREFSQTQDSANRSSPSPIMPELTRILPLSKSEVAVMTNSTPCDMPRLVPAVELPKVNIVPGSIVHNVSNKPVVPMISKKEVARVSQKKFQAHKKPNTVVQLPNQSIPIVHRKIYPDFSDIPKLMLVTPHSLDVEPALVSTTSRPISTTTIVPAAAIPEENVKTWPTSQETGTEPGLKAHVTEHKLGQSWILSKKNNYKYKCEKCGTTYLQLNTYRRHLVSQAHNL